MRRWTDQSATAELQCLVDEIGHLRNGKRFCAEHTRWSLRVLRVLEQVFGRQSRYYVSFESLRWSLTGRFSVGAWVGAEGSLDPEAVTEGPNQQAYLRDLESAKGFLLAAIDELQRVGIDAVYEGKDTGPESSGLVKVLTLIEQKLRKALHSPPTKEREVQDAFETLLVGTDIRYSRETESIEYSSKTYTPDFTFRQLDLAVEVKLCGRPEREKEIIAEINDDIVAYATKYGNQIFAVYDLGRIRDVDRFARAFEGSDGVLVRVVKQ